MVVCRGDYCAWEARGNLPTKLFLIQLACKVHLLGESAISGCFSSHHQPVTPKDEVDYQSVNRLPNDRSVDPPIQNSPDSNSKHAHDSQQVSDENWP